MIHPSLRRITFYGGASRLSWPVNKSVRKADILHLYGYGAEYSEDESITKIKSIEKPTIWGLLTNNAFKDKHF